jgi:Spy/CpxP family protein refolding chaperone
MKKLGLMAVLALGGLLLCSTAVMAQDTSSKEGKRKMPTVQERMDKMQTDLNLTDDQKPKVKAALEENQKEMQGVRDLPQDQRREKARETMKSFDTKMKGILTPDQYTKWEASHAQYRGKKKSE